MSNMSNPPRILVVEPNKNALSVMAKRLTEVGYRVIACDSAKMAVAELYRHRADLVISELRMPVMSGIDLTRLIRDETQLKDIPVILITARTDVGGAVEGFGAGSDDVVAKPFDFEVLIARVARQLARARAVRELRDDKAILDARVTTRAIELGEARAALKESEAARRRLERMVGRA